MNPSESFGILRKPSLSSRDALDSSIPCPRDIIIPKSSMYSAVVPHTSFVALFTLLIASTSATCYYPNGTDVTTSGIAFTSYAPCNASAEASMCCRINVTAGDHCRSDGLCDSPDYRYLWRESCTDPTWKSPHCQKLCLNYDGKSSLIVRRREEKSACRMA